MKTVFENAKIVTPESVINGCVAVENGVITHIGDGSDVPTDGERTDCGGKYLLAGFVDIHCHGGNGFDFMDASPQEMKKIADFHLLHGTTSLLATTLTDGYAALEAALENYRRLEKSGAETSLIGVHLEGPWFSPEQCGAQDVSDMKNPDAEVLKRWLKEYPFVKRVSVAPELAGGMDIGKVGKARGAVMSIGHTDADFETVAHARENGYTLLTHLYSGMKGVTRKNAYRIAGAVEAGLFFDDLYVEVIADGKHLPAELLKFIYKIKGADKICLITDCVRGGGLAEGEKFVLGRKECGTAAVVQNGVAKTMDGNSFAGSVSTTDIVFKTMAKACGADLVALSKMASATPSRALGLKDRGEIALGKRADLIIINENSDIERVYFNGGFIK